IQRAATFQPACAVKCQTAATTTLISVMGSRNFQARFMNWSVRKRGIVPRAQMNRLSNTNSFVKNQTHDGMKSRNAKGDVQPPRNKVMPSPQMENKPKYSPRKKSANLKPLYSVK